MEIFSIPVEVVDCCVLPYLGWNDLLRLRRVCKWTKGITDGYLKVHPELAPEIEINEEERSFGAFLKMGIPTTRIYLKNTSGGGFYQNGGEDASKFLEKFGRLIKSLRAEQISILVFGKEWDFLNALKNLQSFEAGRYGGYSRELNPDDDQDAPLISHIQRCKDDPLAFLDGPLEVFPKDILKNLKTLKIGNNKDDDGSYTNLYGYMYAFLFGGDALETFALPGYCVTTTALPIITFILADMHGNQVLPPNLNEARKCPLLQYFGLFKVFGPNRTNIPPPACNISNFKLIDFGTFHDFDLNEEQRTLDLELASKFFVNLCNSCTKAGIKFMNVASRWFWTFPRHIQLIAPDIGTPIVSLINIDPFTLSLAMPNLEKIEIRKTSQSSAGRHWLQQQVRPIWPALKTLEITVDSNLGSCWEYNHELQITSIDETNTDELFNFFFRDISRNALTDLKLEFLENVADLPVPEVEHIVASCPNLKKLTLINWQGTNEALTILWNGLPALEEVSLEFCKDLGNSAFAGEDVDSPVFLKLTKLRKLTLKGLDQMPKIADTLFSFVFRHLPLNHLILTSNAPVQSITVEGIRSLCDGRFAESIQKFPFQNWELPTVSSEEFKKCQDLFRSTKFL